MNIRKYSLKTMCAALACTTVLSSTLAAYATDVIINETPMDDSVEINSINTLADDSAGTGSSDSGWTTEENSFEDIKVTYQQSSSYAVTIPKTIALGVNKQATYAVKVTGDIDTKQRVYVAPVDGITETADLDFYMKEKDNKKENVAATVTQDKTYWSSEDVANSYEETNNSVSAPDLTAGTWEGTFQVEIRLETEKEQEHTHDYVDGKCSCGAIDPNHTHNYEDGTCTICGKEQDPYETAPASAYSNWNYTLDDENGIITLNYYKGSETDVIVYANYVIGGKTYKTQLANNSFGAMNSYYMFNGCAQANCQNIKTIKFNKNIDTSNVKNMNCMFNYCKSLTELDLSSFDTSNVTSMEHMFYDCISLTSLDISGFNTSNVTNMYSMFSACFLLTTLDLRNFDTSKVTNMYGMFKDCKALTDVNVSSFDTSNVTNMSNMFANCQSLKSIDICNFDTSNVTTMGSMFNGCSSLTSLNVSNWKNTNTTNMSYMFSGCTSLTSIDLTNFNTSSVTDMYGMFKKSSALMTLDLTSFDTRNVDDMIEMFYYCTSLNTIYVTKDTWSTSLAQATQHPYSTSTKYGTYYMFNNCGTSSVTYK